MHTCRRFCFCSSWSAVISCYWWRTTGAFWLKPFPNIRLGGAIFATQVFAVCMVAFGWGVPALGWSLIGLVWAYCVLWMFLLELGKMLTVKKELVNELR
jgi:hypothetical protein